LTTVQALRTRTDQPASLHTDTPRIWPIEKKTYIVRARVISAKIEEDSDIHLVISQRNATSRKMIVEFPAPTCVDSAFKRPAIGAAREAMLSNCGAVSSSHVTELMGNVEVTGVGFWDEIHGQTGVAPNGIEIHPVLKFTGDCSGGGGPGAPSARPRIRTSVSRRPRRTLAAQTWLPTRTSRSCLRTRMASTGTTTGLAASSDVAIDYHEIGSRIIVAVGETGANELLDALTRSEADRAALIGRLTVRDDAAWLAELLTDLEIDEIARLHLVEALRRELAGTS
jgi:hypothetical protein